MLGMFDCMTVIQLIWDIIYMEKKIEMVQKYNSYIMKPHLEEAELYHLFNFEETVVIIQAKTQVIACP